MNVYSYSGVFFVLNVLTGCSGAPEVASISAESVHVSMTRWVVCAPSPAVVVLVMDDTQDQRGAPHYATVSLPARTGEINDEAGYSEWQNAVQTTIHAIPSSSSYARLEAVEDTMLLAGLRSARNWPPLTKRASRVHRSTSYRSNTLALRVDSARSQPGTPRRCRSKSTHFSTMASRAVPEGAPLHV
jgi:hypothetical protein